MIQYYYLFKKKLKKLSRVYDVMLMFITPLGRLTFIETVILNLIDWYVAQPAGKHTNAYRCV